MFSDMGTEQDLYIYSANIQMLLLILRTSTMAFTVYLPDLTAGQRNMPPRIPLSAYRHAGPSGPWPWADMVEDDHSLFNPVPEVRLPGTKSGQSSLWRTYPTNLFPNWEGARLVRSGIAKLINKKVEKTDPDCVVYYVNVEPNGRFSETAGQYRVPNDEPEKFLQELQRDQSKPSRVKILFVENLSGPVLQMLGTIYKIEPFYFSSSLNWIPSRYQEDPQQNEGDHITITLNFLRVMPNPMTAPNTPATGGQFIAQMLSRTGTATIDTQGPLVLRSNGRIILLDLLAIHMVRRKGGSTIISYHPPREWKSTSALYLRTRVGYAGASVYWRSLFQRSNDPTLILLSMLWYALYAWDEALENLYLHICWLESRVLVTNDIHLTRELYIIRASLLHYTSLLQSFKKTVMFVQTTPNPAMQDDPGREEAERLLTRECETLISEIDRLEMFRSMQDMRLENVMNLAFASVNLEDSRHTRYLSEAALRDSAVMKQISYMTMIFLPASFAAAVFGMNVSALDDSSSATVPQYLAVTIPLTLFTIWIMVALHRQRSRQDESDHPLSYTLKWPFHALLELWRQGHYRRKNEAVV